MLFYGNMLRFFADVSGLPGGEKPSCRVSAVF